LYQYIKSSDFSIILTIRTVKIIFIDFNNNAFAGIKLLVFERIFLQAVSKKITVPSLNSAYQQKSLRLRI